MIPQIKKILYSTDLSKNSVYAFRYATKMAEKFDAEIIILHVVEPIPPMAQHSELSLEVPYIIFLLTLLLIFSYVSPPTGLFWFYQILLDKK